MFRRAFLLLAIASLTLFAQPAPKTPAATNRPKLVVLIVIDQLRLDYLYRFQDQYTAGFKRFWDKAAFFTNAYYEHFPTVTAVGHSTIGSGALPSVSGIVGNEWFDRESGTRVESITDLDPKIRLLGNGDGTSRGASPRRLLVSTLADEIKMSGRGESKTIGISIKDRSAILPSGHTADGAYWFDGKTGNFISSTYYFSDLPQWVKDENAKRPAKKFADRKWVALADEKKPDAEALGQLPPDGPKLYTAIEATPFGNDMLLDFANAALDAEKLGQHSGIDVLTISFSSNDYVGHAFGPDSPQVRDASIRTDRQLGQLLSMLDKKVGLNNIVLALSADHGVAPVPEVNEARKMPGGRVSPGAIKRVASEALTATYGAVTGDWFENVSTLYIKRSLVAEKKIDLCQAERVVAAAVRSIEGIARAYPACELRTMAAGDFIDARVRNGFHERGPDVAVVMQPYWIASAGKTGTTHGEPYSYDTHVPLILMGPGIKPGRYHRRATPNDIAVTLSTLLQVETPSGCNGRVLEEALQ